MAGEVADDAAKDIVPQATGAAGPVLRGDELKDRVRDALLEYGRQHQDRLEEVGELVPMLNARVLTLADEKSLGRALDLAPYLLMYLNSVRREEEAADVVIMVVLKYSGKTPHDVPRRVVDHTYESICAAVEAKWPELVKVDYQLSWAGGFINDDNDLQTVLKAALAASKQQQNNKQEEAAGQTSKKKENTTLPTATITVTNQCRGFTEFKLEEALLYLGCKQAGIPVDDAAFAAPELTEAERKELKYLAKEVHRRIPIYGPFHEAAEFTNREFIGPVLLCAARIATNVKLRAEYQLRGTLGNGPADYAALCEDLAIVIAEAKHCKVEDAVPQNLAQVAASREQYLRLNSAEATAGPACGTKRKAYQMDDLQRVPTSGIATTGLHYIFMRYEQYPKPRVYKSEELLLPLTVHQSWQDLMACLEPVVRRIVGILRLQKAAVDAQKAGKQPRVESPAGDK